MNVISHESATAFLDAALDPLLREEEKNNLMIGIALRVSEGRSYGDQTPLFLTVHHQGELVAAALRTPPYPLILHCECQCDDALHAIADYLIDVNHRIPGVNGIADIAGAFADLWAERVNVLAVPAMALRIYSLTEVVPVDGVAGHVRWAREDDVPTLAKWFYAFCDEAVPEGPPAEPEKSVRRFMDTGRLAVWDDGGLVSMSGSSRGTPHGATVGAVYTPPELRGHGYASGCVAALSQSLLDDGNRFCALYTDLSNPTSNKIYQNIGYRPIVDCAMLTFEDAKE